MNKTTTTRRSFLKSSLATGTAALICGTKGQVSVHGANDRLRIAVAGLNGRGGSHINGWLGQKNVEIAYLIDPDEKAVARKMGEVEKKTKGKLIPRGLRIFARHWLTSRSMRSRSRRRTTGTR